MSAAGFLRRERAEPRSARPRGGLRLAEIDWHVLAVAFALAAIGLVFLRAMSEASSGLDPSGFRGHLVKLGVAAPMLVVGLAARPRWLRRWAFALYGLSLLSLVLLFWLGVERNGARSWIDLGAFDLQPSELAKLGLILALARTLYRNRLKSPAQWGAPLLVALVPMGLVAAQPDLGTALTIVPITLGMLWIAGARAGVLVRFGIGAALLGGSAAALGLGLRDYQLERVETWVESFDPENLIAEKRGPAFHAYHTHVCIGNGGFLGTGLGRGVANKAGYLPERDSDSIFAVIAEESGWLGATSVLVLYGLLILLLFAAASNLRDRFSRLVVAGVGLYLAGHLFINVGVNLGLVPMTGLTLPLLSTGGSSLLATFLALGLALGLAARREPSLDQDAFRE